MSKQKQQPMSPRSFGRGHSFGAPVVKAKNFKVSFKRLASYLAPKKFMLGVVFVSSIIATVFTILSPKILGKATDVIFRGVMARFRHLPNASIDFGKLAHIGLVLLLIYLGSAIFNFLMQYLMADVAQDTVYRLRKEINLKLGKMPLAYFDRHPHGDLLSRVTNDVDNISNTLQQSLTQLLTSVVTILGVIFMMISINLWLTLIVLVTLPLSALLMALIIKRSQKHFKKQQNILGQINGHVEEMFGGHRVVQAFGREQESIKKFEKLNGELFETGWRAQFISGMMMPFINVVNNLGYVLVAVAGGWFVLKRWVTIGNVQAFIQYSRQFGQPLVRTSNIANIIQSTVASAERVFEVLDEVEERQYKLNTPVLPKPVRGRLNFDKVSFAYLPDKPLIENLSFEIQPGETLAIVGPTGAGKTTLVNLIMRFYEVQRGNILIDDHRTKDFDYSEVRGLFGMVLQDTWLFHGTIYENISYGRENVTEDQVYEAAKLAGAHHFILALPDGYQTVLNEETDNLSQGQKQLITIARAMLAQPPMMILDEATSSVDTRTELKIQEAMKNLMKDRTSIVIAHRLSTIRNAHMILVMDNGNIVEQGNHETLMRRNGVYADLYRSQFAGVSV